MKRRNSFAALIFALSCLAVVPQATAQTNNLEQKIKRLVLAVGEAERTINAEKFAALTTDDFSESQTNGMGTKTKSKSQILDELRKAPEGFKKVFSMVKVESEMTDASAKKSGDNAEFKFLLTEHSLLKITEDGKTDEFKKVERFETTGTAVRRNGNWLLSSWQKKLSVNSNKAQFDSEIVEQMNFGMATLALLVDSEKSKPPLINTELTAPIDPTQAKMIFRREYYNYARGFRHSGWFIDLMGNVYKYEYKYANNGQPGVKFDFKTPPTLVSRIAPELVFEKLKLSQKAAQGSFSRKTYARDAGTLTYSAFLANPLTNKFDEIKLKESGDFAGTNDAPEAAALAEWLETVFRKP